MPILSREEANNVLLGLGSSLESELQQLDDTVSPLFDEFGNSLDLLEPEGIFEQNEPSKVQLILAEPSEEQLYKEAIEENPDIGINLYKHFQNDIPFNIGAAQEIAKKQQSVVQAESTKAQLTTPEPEKKELEFMEGPRTAGEVWDEYAANPWKLVPFMSAAVEVNELQPIIKAAYALYNNTETEEDLNILKQFIYESGRDSTFKAKVMSVVLQLPSFAGEMAATYGIYTFGRKAGMKGAQKILEKLLKEGGEELIDRRLTRIAIKSAGGITGGTLQTPFAGITRIHAGTVKNMMPNIKATIDEFGEISVMVNDPGEDVGIALLKAFGEQWVETVSEHSGGLFSELGEPIMKSGIISSFMRANPNKSVSEFKSMLKRFGWNGIINEMLEERVAEVGRAVLGLDDWKLPTLEQLAVELVSFSFPGAAIAATGKSIEIIEIKKQKQKVKKLVDKINEDDIPFTIEFDDEHTGEVIESESWYRERNYDPEAEGFEQVGEENGEKQYKAISLGFNRINNETGSISIILNSKVGGDVVAEEVIEGFFKQAEGRNPELAEAIRAYARGLREKLIEAGKTPGVSDIELFSKAFVFHHLGYANVRPDYASLYSIPKEMYDSFVDFMGDFSDGTNIAEFLKGDYEIESAVFQEEEAEAIAGQAIAEDTQARAPPPKVTHQLRTQLAHSYPWDETQTTPRTGEATFRLQKQQSKLSLNRTISLKDLEDTWEARKLVYTMSGTINPKKESTDKLKIYNLDNLIKNPDITQNMLNDYGFIVEEFSFVDDNEKGVKFRLPKLKKNGYDKGVVWIYNPKVDAGSFKDEEYTRAWRVYHEVGHGISEQYMEEKYGPSQREGRLGIEMEGTRGKPPKQVKVTLPGLTLKEAQRAVEWEDVAFRTQRMLLEEHGVGITDEEFGREFNINITDAMYRVLTGDFGDPGEYGYIPDTKVISLKSILRKLDNQEKLIAESQNRKPTDGIDLSTWKQITDAQLKKAISNRKDTKSFQLRSGVVFLGGDAVSVDMDGKEYPSGYQYPEEFVGKNGSGWQLSLAGATKIKNMADDGFTSIAIVVYPNIKNSMRRNPIYQKALEREINSKHNKLTAKKFIRQGKKIYDAKEDKSKTSVMAEAAKLAGVSLVGTARKIGTSEFEQVGGKIVGVGEFNGIRTGDDRIVKHEVYPAEVLFSNYQRLPKPIPFQEFVNSLSLEDRKKKGAYMMLQTVNFWLNKKDSKLIPKLIKAGKGDVSILEQDITEGVRSFRLSPDLVSKSGFYSTARAALNKFPESMNSLSVNNWLKKSQVKPEEMEWLDIETLLKGRKKISKQELDDWIKANEIVVEEVHKGWQPGEKGLYNVIDGITGEIFNSNLTYEEAVTKAHYLYKDTLEEFPESQSVYLPEKMPASQAGEPVVHPELVLPGGEDYRELLLTWPSKGDDPFEGDHFDEPNIIVHIRFNTRYDKDGNKVLFIEEIQSDWHQEAVRVRSDEILSVAKKRGISKEAAAKIVPDDFEYKKDMPDDVAERENILLDEVNLRFRRHIVGEGVDFEDNMEKIRALQDELNEIFKQYPGTGVSNAPFKGDGWLHLSLKRMLRYAAENDFDKLSWTTGAQQVDRYETATRAKVDKIHWQRGTISKSVSLMMFEDFYKQAFPKQRQRKGEQAYWHREKWEIRITSDTPEALMDDKRVKIWRSVIDKHTSISTTNIIVNGIKNDRSIGTFTVPVSGTTNINGKDVSLDNLLGKPMANKIRESKERTGTLQGADLTIGGEGMKMWYDNKLPSFLKKYGKKWGVQLGTSEMPFRRGGLEGKDDFIVNPSISITTKMKDSVLEGQATFRLEGKEIPDWLYADVKEEKISIKRPDKPNAYQQWLVPISQRLFRINPELRRRIRMFDYKVMSQTESNLMRVMPFINSVKKLDGIERIRLELALMNGDSKMVDIIFERNKGLKRKYMPVRKVLDEIYDKAEKAGFDMGFIDEYFPRMISDHEGFIKFMYGTYNKGTLDKEIYAKEKEIGRKLTMEERGELLSSRIRGFGSKIHEGKPGSTKKRKVPFITSEMNAYYHSVEHSLTHYISNMINAIETRDFFQATEITEETIGDWVSTLLEKGKIKPEQQEELVNILKIRFNPQPISVGVNTFRALGYITSMGSISSAITQIGDLTWAVYLAPAQSLGAWGRAVVGKSKIKKSDIGINRVAQEFSDFGGLSKALNNLFKATGLEWMDKLGKETLINATIEKYQKLAKSGKLEGTDMYRRLEEAFGEETGKVIGDLKRGIITERIKYLAFYTLADFQPISLSEMPETYLKSPYGRVMYMLKTFTIKQFDAFRNESINLMRKGYREDNQRMVNQGFKNFVHLAAIFMLANASADVIKDLIFNRKIKMNDYIWDNVLRLFGVHRFLYYYAKRYGWFNTAWRAIAPPIDFLEVPLVRDAPDIIKAIKDGEINNFKWNEIESIKLIPLFGKLYYWWFGKGPRILTERAIKDARKSSKTDIFDIDTEKEYKQHLDYALEMGWFDEEKHGRWLEDYGKAQRKLTGEPKPRKRRKRRKR